METQVVYGIHAANRILQYHHAQICQAQIIEGADSPRLQAIIDRLQTLEIEIQYLVKDKLGLIAKSSQHQGVIFHITPLAVQNENDLIDSLETATKGYFVVLDTVEDPRNLGACIRTAESLGAQGVIIPKDKSASITPVVRKVACGAADILPVYQVVNLARALRTMQDFGFWMYGTGWSETSTCLYSTQFPAKFAVVMGSEGGGLRQLTAKTCDELITIPMPGITESLNVSVATGIVCGEIVRQQLCQ